MSPSMKTILFVGAALLVASCDSHAIHKEGAPLTEEEFKSPPIPIPGNNYTQLTIIT